MDAPAPPSPTDRSASSGRPDTRQALLDAAEALFAEQGIPATSLRAITRNAGANLAAVNYHFGSKDGLVQAVFARRLEPLNRERLTRLDAVLEAIEAGREPEPLRAVLRAFTAPVVEMRYGGEEGLQAFARLMHRSVADTRVGEVPAFAEQMRDVMGRFLRALASIRPQLSWSELTWRTQFAIGALAHTVGPTPLHRVVDLVVGGPGGEPADVDAPPEPTDADADEPDAVEPDAVEPVVERLLDFVVAGFEAPTTDGSPSAPRPSTREDSP